MFCADAGPEFHLNIDFNIDEPDKIKFLIPECQQPNWDMQNSGWDCHLGYNHIKNMKIDVWSLESTWYHSLAQMEQDITEYATLSTS